MNINYWNQALWEQVMTARKQDRLAHALLLSGVAGLGKRLFATALIDGLLCSDVDETGQACGDCRGCRLRSAGNHPDLLRVIPEEDKTSIGVDAVRDIGSFLSLTSFAGGFKIALVDPAEAMTLNASNGLLKTLEEPPANSILILICEQPARLPATVRSRCQDIRFAAPARDVALDWLAQTSDSATTAEQWAYLLDFAGGAPLQAIALASQDFYEISSDMDQDLRSLVQGRADPIAVAARWIKLDAAMCLDWLTRQVQGLIRINSGAREDSDLSENSLAGPLETCAAHLQNADRPLNLNRLFAYLDQVQRVRGLLGRSVNKQLAFEALLIPWRHDMELLPDLTG